MSGGEGGGKVKHFELVREGYRFLRIFFILNRMKLVASP